MPTKTSRTTSSAPSDGALVALCLDGDGTAWSTLVERHGPLVWAVAHRMRLSRADAEEVFQNTWTIALEELSRVRQRERVGAWIGRVARHQSLRVRRGYGIARRAREHVAREDVDETLPEEELVRLEERGRVAVALERIGERCARLLRALYHEAPRPAYTEIAERLGMRIGSIGPTRARCLQKLEGELGSPAP
jgi:RNA polymerase sigma factor (sigma-70 family)